MEVGGLYSLVLTIVLVGILVSISVIVLEKFDQSAGWGNVSNSYINGTITAITPITSTWLPIIVTVSVAAVVLVLMIRAFSGGGMGQGGVRRE